MATTTQGFANGEELLTKALEHVESKSIRAWAQTEHNRPLWVKIAQGAVDKKGPSCDVHMFAAYIVATAMGM